MTPHQSFDIALLREYSERQERDAQRIIMLCDAAQKLHTELQAAQAELAALKKETP